jgi:hypothetical protein
MFRWKLVQVLQLWLGRRDLRESSAASKQRPQGKVWVGKPSGGVTGGWGMLVEKKKHVIYSETDNISVDNI